MTPHKTVPREPTPGMADMLIAHLPPNIIGRIQATNALRAAIDAAPAAPAPDAKWRCAKCGGERSTGWHYQCPSGGECAKPKESAARSRVAESMDESKAVASRDIGCDAADTDALIARLEETHCDTCNSRLIPGYACSCVHGEAAAALRAAREDLRQVEEESGCHKATAEAENKRATAEWHRAEQVEAALALERATSADWALACAAEKAWGDAAHAALKAAVEVLHWLNNKGRLGLDTHAVIQAEIAKARAALADEDRAK